ncbi:hypothetical protein M0R45_034704 [Rubus argutus]|uniref:Uncharacterized protein n=1 Tax=Rubus argutus TaxID=59490 RepID=A0AAW1VTX3_RUBAR
MVSQKRSLDDRMNLGNVHQASIFCVGLCNLHAAMLVRLRLTATQPYLALQLVTGYEPDVSHLRIFGIRFLEPLTGDLFTTLVGCHSDETVFPPLGGDKNVTIPDERRELTWNVPTMSHLDPRTA